MQRVMIMALLISVLYGCGSSKAVLSADKTPIMTSMDLINVTDDKVRVEINPGRFTEELVSFYIPKTVPGTYSTDNYGKYIEGFQALDYDGTELSVSKADENTWKISNGKNLDKITYWVNDMVL